MIGTSSGGTLWQRVTATSGYTVEKESTAFASIGKVQTADGRNIDFQIEFGMSRAFMNKINTLTSENYILTDPLVINLDTDVASVTDQKFFFDLDSDGEEEEISFAGEGSGFLALDKNGDGKINDGNELFGTQSGNGLTARILSAQHVTLQHRLLHRLLHASTVDRALHWLTSLHS